MTTYRLLAAASAALTFCVCAAASAAEECAPSANGDCLYDGRLPPISERNKGSQPRDKVHMSASSGVHYARQPIIASVDQGKNNRNQIRIVFNE